MDTCRHKLNNSIIPFEQANEQFLRYVAWHVNTTGGVCPFIWTPLRKLESEGLFFNMNSNSETTIQNWAKGQPNGGKNEKYVAIKVAHKALADIEAVYPTCSSCRISKLLLLQLDGRCEHSLIGKVRLKSEYIS